MFERALALILLATVSWGQSGNLSGPLLGLAYDPSAQVLRPLWGIAGAATQGQPLDLGASVVAAAVSAEPGIALAGLANADRLVQVRLAAGELTLTGVDGSYANARRLAYSRNGRIAVALYDEPRAIQVIDFSVEPITISRTIDPPAFPSTVVSLAVSDAGVVAMGTVPAEGDAESRPAVMVWVAGAASPVTLEEWVFPAALAFSTQGQLAVADRDARTVTIFRDLGGANERTVVATADQGIREPLGLRFNNDDRRLLIANGSDHSIIVVELDRETPTAAILECACAPTIVEPLNGPLLFRLSNASDGPLWMLDIDPAEPRVLFVPPARSVR